MPEQNCDACGKALPKGAEGSRPGLISWSEVRFCAGCVEHAVAASARPGLRVIDGGAKTRAG